MAYETPITIKQAIDDIKRNNYVLPSIQREFVWDTEQIETLFDSLMRDYPISTFLFWKVDKVKVKDFQFYEFLKNYHKKDNTHNKKIELSGDEDVIALLDGQQRMTSFYIALSGTYADKIRHRRLDDPNAYPKKKLYLNLLQPSDDIEVEYNFKFLSEEEAAPSEGFFWFECGKMLEFTDLAKAMKFLKEQELLDSSKYPIESLDFAFDTLTEFFNVIHQKPTINFYLEKGETLDKVLQIFIRINSGGTKLDYSDLLLSIATAKWQEKDARETIHEFVDDINKIGDGFSFNKDLVLKACLVLADFKDVQFKVDNFVKDNMLTIEKKWSGISGAVRTAVELVSKFGYNRDNLLAANAVIPIAYFIYKNEFESKMLHSAERETDRKAIKEWLGRSFLKGIFGGQSDALFPAIRTLVNNNLGKFPLEEIIAHYKGDRKSIIFTEDDVENIMSLKYGTAKTYCALTLLYPSLNYNFKYHQDHIHPKSFFTKNKLKKLGISGDKIDSYIENFNLLPNLQLLQANQNIEKSDKHFDDWLKQAFPSSGEQASFLMQNHIKPETSLAFDDFLALMSSRKDMLKNQFSTILNISKIEATV